MTDCQSMTEEEAKEWQNEFPILKDVIHVGNCSQAPQSLRVRKAIHNYLNNWLMVGMDWDYWMDEVLKAKQEFANLIHAQPEEISISSSVSTATAAVLSSLKPEHQRNKIVLTEAEFPTIGHVSLAHKKYGFDIDFIPVRDGQIDVHAYDQYVDLHTLITATTFVYYQNGFKQDLERIADIVHAKGSLFFVDAYQGIGTADIDVKALDIDILTTGNLKYLLGLPGISFTYIKKELINQLEPTVTGWFGTDNPFAFDVKKLNYAPDARRFDTGTPPIMPAFVAKAGMEIINEVGLDRIEKRIDELSRFTLQEADKHQLDVTSPTDIKAKGAVTAIRVPDAHHVEEELKKRHIIASARGDVIRIAPHFFTTKQDIKQVLLHVQSILRNE